MQCKYFFRPENKALKAQFPRYPPKKLRSKRKKRERGEHFLVIFLSGRFSSPLLLLRRRWASGNHYADIFRQALKQMPLWYGTGKKYPILTSTNWTQVSGKSLQKVFLAQTLQNWKPMCKSLQKPAGHTTTL